MDFLQKLDQSVTKNNSLFCVGLDPDIRKLPPTVVKLSKPLFEFNKAIIDATADLVCTFKLNSAMYEATGAEGVKQLQQTCNYIQKNYPDIPTILDFKRADIGNTNNFYAAFAFDYLQVDAITINPYMGKSANQEFLNFKEKGIVVLCRTSNPGAGEFQDMEVDGKPLYQHVAQHVMTDWNQNNNCLLVTGATYAAELHTLRKQVGPTAVFLVPGTGAQGGDLTSFVKAGLGKNKRGLIINSSRETIFASNGSDFANAARNKAMSIRDEINKLREGSI